MTRSLPPCKARRHIGFERGVEDVTKTEVFDTRGLYQKRSFVRQPKKEVCARSLVENRVPALSSMIVLAALLEVR
jgi:hypothetical protein